LYHVQTTWVFTFVFSPQYVPFRPIVFRGFRHFLFGPLGLLILKQDVLSGNNTNAYLYVAVVYVEWSKVMEYLGVYLLRGRSAEFDTYPVKWKSYAVCDSDPMHGSNNDELLTLQKSCKLCSLLVLMIAIPTLKLTAIHKLMNLVFAGILFLCKIFGHIKR
jgi:hypothetical protein